MSGRIRTIKPELLDDDKTATLDHDAWRLFVSLLLVADDYGNMRAHPAQLEGTVFWGRAPRETLANILETLANRSLIARYAVRGQEYLTICGWTKHQRVDRPGIPRVPGPDDPEATVITGAAQIRESLANHSRADRVGLATDHDHDHDHDHLLSRSEIAPALDLQPSPEPDPEGSKKAKPKKARHPDFAAFRDRWLKAYLRRYGRGYVWEAKDNPIASRLLRLIGIEELARRCGVAFALPDSHWVLGGSPLTIGRLAHRINELSTTPAPERKKAEPKIEADWEEIGNLATEEAMRRERGIPIPWLSEPRRWAMTEDMCGHALEPAGPGRAAE